MSVNPCCVAEERKDVEGDDRWTSIHNRFLVEAKEKSDAVEILFIGDDLLLELSHTDIYKDFEEMHPMNFSIRGDRIENLLWRITVGGELDRVKPKIIVIGIGSNNTDNSEEEISEGILEVLKEIRKRQDGFIVLLTLLPRGQKPNKLREKSEKVNQLIQEHCRGMLKVQTIDISKGLIQSDGSISHHDMYDYLNLSNAASKKVFEPVLDLLNQILNENEKELLTPSE